MTISYNWLKAYIDIQETAEEIGKVLTATGLEVETIEKWDAVRGGLEGLVLGEVKTCVRHPNADKLSLTTVDVGNDTILNIVCGAPNVAAGQRVVVATPGTTIYPTDGEPFTIKKAKIRGEESSGMICAEDEIGLGASHAGIMVLDTDLPNGTPAAQFFKLESDYILEIGLTPNRADAASHIGVARDIRAAKDRAVKWPSVDEFAVQESGTAIPVEVIDQAGCPRFSGVYLKNISVAESPSWLKQRLLAIGLTPINNVVDITNFVCHEMGQPLHAYDASKIRGNVVRVQTLPEGTAFKTLDGKERKLLASDLMICDADGGMCIAGVFGGEASGVTNETTAVFLESACFNPDYIRKTAQHHQLKTDASFRNERGTDPRITVTALKRAAMLLQELAGGIIASDIIDIYPEPIENILIQVKDKNVDRLIGKVIPREEVFQILNRLDIEIMNQATDMYTVSVPPYRVDVKQEADVVEEILRIYGFDNIPLAEETGTDFLAPFAPNDVDNYRRSLGEQLTANGFFEIWTNSLTNQSYQEKHELTFDGAPVEILNKLSEEQGILRQTMLFTGLEVCAYNINRKQKDVKFFEFGKIYYHDNGYKEEQRLALYMTGLTETENWLRKPVNVDYFDLVQQVQNVLTRCGISDATYQPIDDQLFEYAVEIKSKKSVLGKAGKVKDSLLKHFGIKQDLFYGELDSALLFRRSNPKLVIQEIPKYPEVRRDLSLVVDKGISFEEIRNLVHSAEKRLIKSIIVFDVYEGDKIPSDKKAYAMGFTLQDEAKTLTDQEIEKTMTRLMKAFEEQLGAMIRK